VLKPTIRRGQYNIRLRSIVAIAADLYGTKSERSAGRGCNSPRRLILKMENQNIKEMYNKIGQKHKELPDFDKLDNEFEISALEEPFILRAIRRKITEKVDFYANLIKDLLQPESDMRNMYECRAFGDNEKEEVYNILKKLMFFSRLSAEAAIKSDEKEDIKFLNNFFDEWLKMKPNLLKIVSKMKDSWEKETELKEDLGYFG
jgi:hypothetical protein